MTEIRVLRFANILLCLLVVYVCFLRKSAAQTGYDPALNLETYNAPNVFTRYIDPIGPTEPFPVGVVNLAIKADATVVPIGTGLGGVSMPYARRYETSPGVYSAAYYARSAGGPETNGGSFQVFVAPPGGDALTPVLRAEMDGIHISPIGAPDIRQGRSAMEGTLFVDQLGRLCYRNPAGIVRIIAQ